MSWAFSRVMAIMLRLPEYHADGVGSRDRGLTCLLRWVFGPRAFLRKGGAGAFAQCRLLCSAKPVHSGYSCEPPCWLLLGEITPAGPYGSWVTWPVLRLGDLALSDAANHTFHFDGIFLLRTSRLQSRQARVHHILRTRKADPPRVQARRLGCDQNRRPHEVVGRHP